MRLRRWIAGAWEALFFRSRLDRDLDEELQAYVDESIERKLRAGLGAAEARRAALAELGGIQAHATAHRTTEIGVRVALGAGAGRVVAQIVGESLRVIGIGLVTGWIVVFVVALHAAPRGTLDAPLLLGVPALLLGVAALACWVPARRATRIDPMVALRHE